MSLHSGKVWVFHTILVIGPYAYGSIILLGSGRINLAQNVFMLPQYSPGFFFNKMYIHSEYKSTR